MSGRQKQSAVKLIRKLCSYYDNGNCMYLDKGEKIPCPQSISYSVCCKFFRNVILEDKEGEKLKAEVFKDMALKHCSRCGRAFYSNSNRANSQNEVSFVYTNRRWLHTGNYKSEKGGIV